MSGPKYGKPGVNSDRNFLRVLIDGKSKILSRDINDSNKALYNIEENVLGQAPTFWSKKDWVEDKVPARSSPYVTNSDGTSIFSTVADRIDYIQNQVEYLYSGSKSGSTRFTFAPGKKEDRSKNIYSSWGTLYKDLSEAEGTKVVFFDDQEYSGRVKVPPSSNGKPYDMRGVEWAGDPSRTDPCDDTLSNRESVNSKESVSKGFYEGNDSGSYSTTQVSGTQYSEISADEYEFVKLLIAKTESNPPSDGHLSLGSGTEVVKYSGAYVSNVGLSKVESDLNNLYYFPIEERGVKGSSTLVHSKGSTADVVSVIRKLASAKTQIEISKGARFNRLPQAFKDIDVLFNASDVSTPAFSVDRSSMLDVDSHYFRKDFYDMEKDSVSYVTPCDEVYMKNSTLSAQGSSIPPISVGPNSRIRFVMEGSRLDRTSALSAELVSINSSSSELEVFGDKDSAVTNNSIRGNGTAVFDIPDFDRSQPNFSGSKTVKGGISPTEISVEKKHLRTKKGIAVDGQVLAYSKNTKKVGFAINGLNQILKQDSSSYHSIKVGGVLVEPETYKSSVSDYVGSFATSLQGPSSIGLTARGYASSIVGGAYNKTESDASYSVVGGYKNKVGGANSTAFGSSNVILGDNSSCFGYLNTSDATSEAASIFGSSNVIDASDFTSIFGSQSKVSLSSYSGINSGLKNELKTGSDYSAIVGGRDNVMQSTSSVILGGRDNTISVSTTEPASFASMIFGYKNKIANADHSVILSGTSNIIDSGEAASDGYGAEIVEYGSILSGCRNKITASNAVVLGGMGALAEKEGDIVVGWSESGEASAENNTIVMNAKTGDLTISGALSFKDNIKLLTHGSNLFSLYGETSPAVYNVQPTDKIIAIDTTAMQKKEKDWGETTGSRWYSGPITVRLPDVTVIDDSGQGGRMIMLRHVCGTSPIYVYPSKNDEKLGAAIDWNDYLILEPGTAKGVFETRYGWFIW